MSDPRNPWVVGSLPIGHFVIKGDYAYADPPVGNTFGGLVVADTSDLQQPVLVGRNIVFGLGGSRLRGTDGFVLAASYQGLAGFNHYHPAPDRPILTCAPPKPHEGLRLSVHTVLGIDLTIQRSAELQYWTDWTEVRMGKEPVQLADPQDSPEGRQFYRGVVK